ncbi:MAG: hypothetical protein ACRENI_03690 [Gemmatimonadaceae bacterium]
MADQQEDLVRRILDEVVEGRRALEERIDGVQESLDQFRLETLANFDAVFQRLERLESEYHALAAGLARLENEVRSERLEREKVRAEIASLRERIAELERRLAQLEADTAEPH